MSHENDFAVDDSAGDNQAVWNQRRNSKTSKPLSKSRRIQRLIFFTILTGTLVGLIAVAVMYSQTQSENAQLRIIAESLHPPSTSQRSPLVWRLNTTVLPTEYKVKLSIHLPLEESGEQIFRTTGSVEITLHSYSNTTKELLFHARTANHSQDAGHLIIAPQDVTIYSGETVLDCRVTFQPETDLVIVTFQQPLSTNLSYTLKAHFSGVIDRKDRSLYQSTATSKRWLLSTNLRPTNTRRFFPCFDEPKFRAAFEMSVEHDARLGMIKGNGRVLGQTDAGNGRVLTTFSPTPNISPHRIGLFLAGDEWHTTSTDIKISQRNNLAVSFVSRATVEKDVRFAGNEIVSLLKTLTSTFNYSGDKLDVVLVPGLGTVASYNSAGLMLLNENIPLINNDTASTSEKVNVALYIGLEAALSVFQSQISDDWWSDAWITGALARVALFDALIKLYPEWQLESFFTHFVTGRSLRSDSHPNSLALRQPSIETPTQIAATLSGELVDKGVAILQMIRGVIGPSNFTLAVKSFLSKRNTSATDYDNFIGAFAVYGGRDIIGHLDGWVKQSGYPVLRLETKWGDIAFKQESAVQGANVTLWHIPLTIRTKFINHLTFQSTGCWLHTASGNLTHNCPKVTIPEGNEFYLANFDRDGYFRTDYDKDNWAGIKKSLNSISFGAIDEVTRDQLLDDAFNLAKTGRFNADYSVALGLTAYMNKETAYTPLATFMNTIVPIDNLLKNIRNGNYDKKMFIYMGQCVFWPLYRQDMWNTNSISFKTEMYNTLVREYACYYNSTSCVADATQKLDDLRDASWSPAQLQPSDTLKTALCYATKFNGTNWMYLYNLSTSIQNEDTKSFILEALACSQTQAQLQIVLDSLLDGKQLSVRNAVRVVKEVMRSSANGLQLGWEFVQRHWNQLPSNRVEVPIALAEYFSSPESLFQMKQFHVDLGYAASTAQDIKQIFSRMDKEAFKLAEAKIESNMAWLAKFKMQVEEFFNKKNCGKSLW